MIEEKTIFVVEDQEFETREDAEAHEKATAASATIDAYLVDHLESHGKKYAEYRKILLGWEAFRVRQ